MPQGAVDYTVAVSPAWVFVTSNENKWREAQQIVGRPFDRLSLALPEIQAATVLEVAVEKGRAAFAALRRPVIVEDAGLELTALGGFPGPFIKFWEKLGGLESICRAADGLKDRRAHAVCALVLCDERGVRPFEGRAAGTIASSPRGANGFGWDAVFVPDGGQRTWGEVTQAEKDAKSHRRQAWELLAKSI